MGWGAAIAGIIGAAGSYASSKQASKSQNSYRSLEQMLPSELLAIFDPRFRGPASSDPRLHGTALGNSLYEMLQQAQYGLPDSLRQRGFADIASGFRGALDSSNRNAALGFGPGALGGADVEASRARASADFGASFEAQSQQQRMAALQPLLNFFAQIQGIRYGAPTTVASTQAPNYLGGAGAGISAYKEFKTPSQGGSGYGSNSSGSTWGTTPVGSNTNWDASLG